MASTCLSSAGAVGRAPRRDPATSDDKTVGCNKRRVLHQPKKRGQGSLTSVVTSKKKRASAGTCFFITVRVEGYISREDVLCLVSVGEVVSYCVSREKDCNGEFHFHVYIQFKNAYKLNYVSGLIRPKVKYLDIESCKSTRNCLRYITKEDDEPYYNVKISQLSQYCQDVNWARNTPTFEFDDPYLSRDWKRYKYLEVFHRAQRNRRLGRGVCSTISVGYEGWFLSCASWWNGRVSEGFIRRRKSLFLYGISGTGKTTCVEMLLGSLSSVYVYHPVGGKFFCQGLYDHHCVVLFEEFACRVFHENFHQLKRLMEGADFSVDVKGGSSRTINFRGVVIFVSNLYPTDFDVALRNRCLFVEACSPFWKEKKVLVPEIKKEVESLPEEEVETIDISSSQE